MEELTESLLVTSLELETTKVRAQEEIKLRDEQLIQLKDMLNKAIRDKNEAQEKCQKLLFEKLLLFQQLQTLPPKSAISSIEEDEPILSSDCEESIVSSPIVGPTTLLQENQDHIFSPLITDKPLPEYGKFLQAVMKAGPLLQTLLLAGPLPQWRHPPPPLDTHQIPPPPVAAPPVPTTQLLHQESFINMSSNNNINFRKRGFCEGSDSSTETKYQRFVPN